MGDSTMADQRVEIAEAIEAGNRALSALNEVERHISTARGLGIWDMLGGGLISGMLKHSKMNDADRAMQQARIELERFQKELKDVQIYYDVAIKFDGFTRFADYFFDNVLVDFLVQTKIAETLNQVKNIKQQVSDTIVRLREIERNL